MRVIFLKDTPRIGKKYEVKDVADGYGRYLIAQKIAEHATKESVARIESRQKQDAVFKKVHTDLLIKNLESLNDVTITLQRKANELGHLFASIHKEEILAELKKETHLDMNPDYVLLEKPIKQIGTYEIPVVIEKSKATFTVMVETKMD